MQQPIRVGGWVRRQGRKVDRRRESKVNRTAAPEDAAADESRRLGLRQNWKVDQETQVERLTGRLSRTIGRRRKLEVSRKAGRRIGRRRESQVDAKAEPEG